MVPSLYFSIIRISILNLLIHPLHKHLLSTRYMPNISPETGEKAVKKCDGEPCLPGTI